MDFQTVVAINLTALSALSLFLGLVLRRRDFGSFALVNALVILVGGFALWALPQEAGSLVSLVFFPLVAAPLSLSSLQARYQNAGRMAAAAQCATLAAFFHPTSAMRLSAALARALAIEDPRQRAEALADLAPRAPTEMSAMIEMRRLADRGDWEKALILAQSPENARPLAAYRLRALGETGRLEEMLLDYARAATSFPPAEQTPLAWLFVLAFAGRPQAVQGLATWVLRLDAETAAYWLAVAKRHAGDETAARAAFEKLASSATETQAAIAARRQLAIAWTPRPPLSEEAQEIVEGVALRAGAESARRARGWRLPPATMLLVAVNSAMFAAELAFGGSENAETLVALGALWKPLALNGEGWRVLTSAFLHYGRLHFALNMMMLALIGRELEHEAGALRTFAIYIGGALFSSITVLALMARGAMKYELYVGASGAIFALFGAIYALKIKDWLRHRTNLAAIQVMALGLAMLIQVAADFMLPMSSLAAHLSGFGFGLLVGMLINPKPPS